MRIYKIIILFFSISVLFMLCGADSTSPHLRQIKNGARTMRCYGTTTTSNQLRETTYRTEWYRCDGSYVRNRYIACAPGFVSVGVYTWAYTDWKGSWVSRCQTACAQITTDLPPRNCRWEYA